MNYTVNGRVVNINGTEIDLGFSILETIEMGNHLLVLLLDKVVPNQALNLRNQPDNNVYSISPNAIIEWNIKDIIEMQTTIIAMEKESENELLITDYSGLKFWIDIEACTVIRKGFTK